MSKDLKLILPSLVFISCAILIVMILYFGEGINQIKPLFVGLEAVGPYGPYGSIVCKDAPNGGEYTCKSNQCCDHGKCANVGGFCGLGDDDSPDRRCVKCELKDNKGVCMNNDGVTCFDTLIFPSSELCGYCTNGHCEKVQENDGKSCAEDGSRCRMCVIGGCFPMKDGQRCEPPPKGTNCQVCYGGECYDAIEDTLCARYPNSMQDCLVCDGKGHCNKKKTCGPCEECHQVDKLGDTAVCVSCDPLANGTFTDCARCCTDCIDPGTGNQGMCINECNPPKNPCSNCIPTNEHPDGACTSNCDAKCQFCDQEGNFCREYSNACPHTKEACYCVKGKCYPCTGLDTCKWDAVRGAKCIPPVFCYNGLPCDTCTFCQDGLCVPLDGGQCMLGNGLCGECSNGACGGPTSLCMG
ncbi:MAG: hypothetical protein ABH834_04865 [Candidatus Altiarchaeota archaeon]